MSKLKRVLAAATAAVMLTGYSITFGNITPVSAAASRQVEALTRSLTVTALSTGTLVNWRYLGTDSTDTVFKLYRNAELIYTSSSGNATCYQDTSGSTADSYTLEVCSDGSTVSEKANAEYVLNYDKTAKGGYFDMTLDIPTDSRLGATYTPNDASAADLDGDGQYELIIKWDPSNSQDNSTSGETSNVIIDAYEFESGDATRLWRIDLGENIRAGAHYTQFMVYDLDGDCKAEMVCKTAPGSKDGAGNYVNTASSVSAIKNAADNTTSYVDSTGRILDGSEYLTLFDGETGKALDTIYYEPARGTLSSWGDTYGNRVDRFLGAVAYLNGQTPSVVMCRGYYARTALAAYNVENKKLVKKWLFDSSDSGNSDFAGQGNHNLVSADVDGDGCDEIVYGSMTMDHNGKGLYSTGLKHGDTLHVGDFIPNRSGLEVYQVHEETGGASLRDAKTGSIIKRWDADGDTGRGVADNIVAGNSSAEFANISDGIVYDSDGNNLMNWSSITKWGQNSLIYWDGDLEREVLDRSMIDDYPSGRIFTGQNITYNNSSKSNMCLTADIFGDWREELVAPLSDGSGVRVYATVHPTDYRIYTLMHNTQYRCGVAAENVGYNQPPHVDYWLNTGDPLPSQPSVYTVGELPGVPIAFKAELRGDDGGNGTYNQPFVLNDTFRLVASADGSIIVADDVKTVGEETINKRINLKIAGSPTTNAIEISAAEAGSLYIGVLSGNSSTARTLSVYNSSGTRVGLLDAPVSGTQTVDLQKVSLPKADTYYIYSTAGSVYIYYIGSTAALNTFTQEQTTESTTKEQTTEGTTKEESTEATTASQPAQDGANHSFNNGTESSFYTINGNLSSNYDPVSYGGETITQCLKMESSTSIGFTSANGSITMVFNTKSAGKSIYLDGTSYTIPDDGILTIPLSSGTHTITKNSGSSFLFYLSCSSTQAETSTETTTATTTTTTTTTTEATTETTTQTPVQETLVTVQAVDGVYSFDNLSGRLTSDESYGGAFVRVTGTTTEADANYVSFSGDGFAYVGDSDLSATTQLVLPVKTKGNKITVDFSFKQPTSNNNWSLMQIHGTKNDGTQGEIAGIRTSSGNYCLRRLIDADNSQLVDTGVQVQTDTVINCSMVIDTINSMAYLTVNGNTVSVATDCQSISEIRFVTATGERNLYVGKTAISSCLLGDADGNGSVTAADAAQILKYGMGIGDIKEMLLADINCDGKINILDAILILKKY